MPRIGFLTMALLKAPRSDASVAGFISRVDKNFAAAETAPGFIDRARLDEETGLYNWGTRGIPSSFPYREVGDRIVQTLSVWNDLESVAAYAYTETHAEALAGRREWCVRATCHLMWLGGSTTMRGLLGRRAIFDSIYYTSRAQAAKHSTSSGRMLLTGRRLR